MAQYEITAPKAGNVSVRAGGRHYVVLAGMSQVVEASGDVAGILEAQGCQVRHVGDEPTAEATFQSERVAAANAAPPEDLNDYAPVEEKVGAPPKNPVGDEEEGVPIASQDSEDEVGANGPDYEAHLEDLLARHGVKTQAKTSAGKQRALEKAGVTIDIGGEEE